MSAPPQFLINGRSETGLSPLDRGFAYGDGVFRTLVVHHGAPRCWQRHYAKLSSDCRALGIVCPSPELLREDISRLFTPEDSGTLKIVITRGDSLRGYAVPPLAQPNRILLKSALPSYPEAHALRGVQLHLCRLRLGHQPALAGIKHMNRLENVLARMEWVEGQIADGLLLDQSGFVIECTMSNLFIRTGNMLRTPDLSRCGVAGVTRERIMELAPRLGYRVRISRFRLDALLRAEEVIICNSLYGAWQVRELDGHQWAAGTLAANIRQALRSEHADAD